MLTRTSILAWRILRTEGSGRLQSIGSQRIGRDWATEHTHARIKYSLKVSYSQVALAVKKKKKNPPANTGDARDIGSIPGSRRSPRAGNGNPPQYSCLENYMNRGAWWTPWGCKETDTTEHTHTQIHVTYTWNLQYDMNELIYETTDSQT